MLTTTMLVMVFAVVAVLFGGLALIGRARGRRHSISNGGDMSWSPAFYGGGGGDFGADPGSGDSGCDTGGGSDSGGGCDGGGGGSD